jgi:hypothetical protein
MLRKIVVVTMFIFMLSAVLFCSSNNAHAAGPAFPWDKTKAAILKEDPKASIIGYRDEGNGLVTVFYTAGRANRWFGCDSVRVILLNTDKGQKWFLTRGESSGNVLIE